MQREPDALVEVIQQCAKEILGVDTLFPRQSDVCRLLLDPNRPPPSVLYVDRTGAGKSLVIRVSALLRGGVTLVIVPLLTLAADQVTKLRDIPNLSAIQLDKLTSSVAIRNCVTKLVQLRTKETGDSKSVILFASPSVLVDEKKPWNQAIIDLAKDGRLSSVVIDEVHMGVSHGLTFRKEFQELLPKLFNPIRQVAKIPWLFMSATVSSTIEREMERMWNPQLTEHVWASPAEMSKRTVKIEVLPRAHFWQTHKSNLIQDYKLLLDNKFIIFVSRKSRIEACVEKVKESMVAAYGAIHDKGLIEIHGSLCVENKAMNIAAFCDAIPGRETQTKSVNTLVATASAVEVGIDQPSVARVYLEGVPSSMESFCQMLGRMGRGQSVRDFVFRCVYNIQEYAGLRGRIHGNLDPKGVAFALQQVEEVIRFMVTGTSCWHLRMENKFGNRDTRNTLETSCGANCPCCSGEQGRLLLSYHAIPMRNRLKQSLNGESKKITELVKFLVPSDCRDREKLFGIKTEPEAYKVEFFVFQLIAAGIIESFEKNECSKWVTYVRLGLTKSSVNLCYNVDNDSLWKTVGSPICTSQRRPIADVTNTTPNNAARRPRTVSLLSVKCSRK